MGHDITTCFSMILSMVGARQLDKRRWITSGCMRGRCAHAADGVGAHIWHALLRVARESFCERRGAPSRPDVDSLWSVARSIASRARDGRGRGCCMLAVDWRLRRADYRPPEHASVQMHRSCKRFPRFATVRRRERRGSHGLMGHGISSPGGTVTICSHVKPPPDATQLPLMQGWPHPVQFVGVPSRSQAPPAPGHGVAAGQAHDPR